MTQKITVGACIEVGLATFFLFFTDGEGDGAVGILLFDHSDQMDDAFICIISVFSTLQDKGTEAKVISFFTTIQDVFF